MGLKLGGKGPSIPVSYFNPLTGGYGAPVRYTQHLDVGKRESNWLPKGLTMAKVKAGDTAGYKRMRAAENVPGWVWVKQR